MTVCRTKGWHLAELGNRAFVGLGFCDSIWQFRVSAVSTKMAASFSASCFTLKLTEKCNKRWWSRSENVIQLPRFTNVLWCSRGPTSVSHDVPLLRVETAIKWRKSDKINTYFPPNGNWLFVYAVMATKLTASSISSCALRRIFMNYGPFIKFYFGNLSAHTCVCVRKFKFRSAPG